MAPPCLGSEASELSPGSPACRVTATHSVRAAEAWVSGAVTGVEDALNERPGCSGSRVGHAMLLLTLVGPRELGSLSVSGFLAWERGPGVCIYLGTVEGVVQGATQKPQDGPVRAAVMPVGVREHVP